VIVSAHGRTLGLVVDSAREFASIPPETIRPLPEGIGGMSGRYLRGIAQQGERLILVVDVAELLTGAMVDTEASSPDAPQDLAPTAPAAPSP
jgi:purine-binding chemotaxis protein CheW